MTVAPPPADEQAAADELDNLLQHLQNSGFSLAAGWSDTKDAIAAKTRIKTAVAAYSRTQTEAVLVRLREHRRLCIHKNRQVKWQGEAVPLSAIDAEIARLRGEA